MRFFMFGFENTLANYILSLFSLSIDTPLGASVHFFIADTISIFILLYLSIFIISLFRTQLAPEKIEQYLQGKSKWYGYILATILGIVTPFCSCSSIPLFMGFLASGIPFGVSMAFLIASPLVSEIAAVLLFGMEGAGPMVALIYILTGSTIAVLAGFLCDTFSIKKLLRYTPFSVIPTYTESATKKEKILITVSYAHTFAMETIRSTALYVLIGLIIGSVMHGYVPQNVFTEYLGRENIFALPFAILVGVPLYASHTGVVPIIQVLLLKNVPIGTALVVLMSVTALSLPELIMLKKVFSYKLLALFVAFLCIAFLISGYIINATEYIFINNS